MSSHRSPINWKVRTSLLCKREAFQEVHSSLETRERELTPTTRSTSLVHMRAFKRHRTSQDGEHVSMDYQAATTITKHCFDQSQSNLRTSFISSLKSTQYVAPSSQKLSSHIEYTEHRQRCA